MAEELRVLMIEDSDADAELVQHELRRGFAPLHCERVGTSAELKAALDRGVWDLLLCDHGLPGFNAPEALKIVKDMDPDLPVIVLSGTIRDEAAMTSLKGSINDYIAKSNFAGLVARVQQQVCAAGERRTTK